MQSIYHQAAGVNWYCEQRGEGPPVVLVPSGEGDCGSFARVAELLADGFSVLTFDMPGFSRTSVPPKFDMVTMRELTEQVASLLSSFGVGPSTVWGCSSGGQVALGLAARYPHLVHRVLVHEVPLRPNSMLEGLKALDDQALSVAVAGLFRNQFNENSDAWDALGDDYHARLAANYITWIRHYVHDSAFEPFAPADLQRRPVVWTVGGLSPVVACFDNFMTAQAAGIQMRMLMSRHFPQVSIPDALAAHIKEHID